MPRARARAWQGDAPALRRACAGVRRRSSALLRAELESAGQVCGPYDLLLAGHALALGLTLVTNNVREFSRVSGLVIEDWLG